MGSGPDPRLNTVLMPFVPHAERCGGGPLAPAAGRLEFSAEACSRGSTAVFAPLIASSGHATPLAAPGPVRPPLPDWVLAMAAATIPADLCHAAGGHGSGAGPASRQWSRMRRVLNRRSLPKRPGAAAAGHGNGGRSHQRYSRHSHRQPGPPLPQSSQARLWPCATPRGRACGPERPAFTAWCVALSVKRLPA